jgi:hypothetical protein
MQKIFFIIFSLLCASVAYAQNDENQLELTAGVEFRALMPVSFFTMDDVSLTDSLNTFNANISYAGGYGFGGVIRLKVTKLLNFESGIYYTNRKYNYDITDEQLGYESSTDIRTVSYEIPIKGLIYIRMAEQVYTNVSIGVSVDFFASDVAVFDSDYTALGYRENWVKLAALGNLGVEYRSKESGYFYIGGSFHSPFGDSYFTQVDYFPNGDNVKFSSNTGFMDGAYFSIDFRYFFAPKEVKRTKVKRVIPDWKNM